MLWNSLPYKHCITSTQGRLFVFHFVVSSKEYNDDISPNSGNREAVAYGWQFTPAYQKVWVNVIDSEWSINIFEHTWYLPFFGYRQCLKMATILRHTLVLHYYFIAKGKHIFRELSRWKLDQTFRSKNLPNCKNGHTRKKGTFKL